MFIRLMLFFSVFFFHLYSQTGSFTTTPTEIPGGTTPEYTVTPCYITKSNQILFAWADNNTSDDPIKYVVYNGKKNTYTAPETIEGSAVYQNIFCCYNESTNQVFFSWEDAVSFKPYYAIYNTSNGSLDAEPTIINAGGYNGVVWNNNVFCCYNNISNQVVFTWSDGAAGSPYYAIYDCQNKNFSTIPTQIGSVTNIAALIIKPIKLYLAGLKDLHLILSNTLSAMGNQERLQQALPRSQEVPRLFQEMIVMSAILRPLVATVTSLIRSFSAGLEDPIL